MKMNHNESDTEDLEKHYRLTLDFRLLVRAITTEVRQESIFYKDQSGSASEPDFDENIERQRRLYALLRNNRQVLEQYLLLALTQDAVRLTDEGLADAFDVKDEDDLLRSLYKLMPEEDARFFEKCRETNVLAENTELISIAFKSEWVGAEIEEISRTVVGDLKRAEVVNQARLSMLKKASSLK